MEADVILKNKMKKQKKNVEETININNRNVNYPTLNDDEDDDAKELNELSESLTNNDITTLKNSYNSSSLNNYLYSAQNTKADNILIKNGYRDLSNGENGALSSSLPSSKSLTSLYTQAQQINTNHMQTAPNLIPNKATPHVNSTINYSNLKLLEPVKHSQEKKQSSNNLNQNEDSNNSDPNTSTNKNNLKDIFNFDSSSLDPFNDMELKTINEIEELKSILQNHNTTQHQNRQELEQSVKNTHKMFYLDNTSPQKDKIPVQQQTERNNSSELVVSSNYSVPTTNNAKNFNLDNFGLPKISFVDLDINSNNL